jgi:hypothetical protein
MVAEIPEKKPAPAPGDPFSTLMTICATPADIDKQAVKRHPAAVLQLCDHRRHALVVLRRSNAFRL